MENGTYGKSEIKQREKVEQACSEDNQVAAEIGDYLHIGRLIK